MAESWQAAHPTWISLPPSWNVQLNVRNILNKFYFYNDYQTLAFSNLVGPPFGVTLTIRRNF